MKTGEKRKSDSKAAKAAAELRQLTAQLAEAEQTAEAAHDKARRAKATYKAARKTYRKARKAAKDLRKQAKKLAILFERGARKSTKKSGNRPSAKPKGGNSKSRQIQGNPIVANQAFSLVTEAAKPMPMPAKAKESI